MSETAKYTPGFSQCQIIGEPRVRSWKDYRKGCCSSFAGGYTHEGDEPRRLAFVHGMNTVFNLLEDEFPPAEQCKAATELLEALHSARDYLATFILNECEHTPEEDEVYQEITAAIAKIKPEGER